MAFGGIVNTTLPPTFIRAMPSSQPWMTRTPEYKLNRFALADGRVEHFAFRELAGIEHFYGIARDGLRTSSGGDFLVFPSACSSYEGFFME
jgi:hypothetical protein